MRVSELQLHHFRNHQDTRVQLGRGVTVFVGSNGQGKTNLVEAIGYLAYQSSHRVSADKSLVEANQDQAVIRAVVENDGRQVDLACEINAVGANRAKVGGKAVPVGQLAGWLRAVLFTPEDLAVVRGEPAGRRRYLDQTMTALRPSMVSLISDYDRVVKQRNALLKSNRGRPTAELENTLRGWDERLIELAIDYTTARQEFIRELSPIVAEVYAVIAPGNEVGLSLETSSGDVLPDAGDLAAWYAEAVSRARSDEWDRGMTLVGPHRDDVAMALNGLPARTHSSQGEAWSLALALRMAQAVLFRRDSHSGDPVMILDDVFAELDRARRSTLERLVADYEQVLVTAAVWEDIPESLREVAFTVEAGGVNPRGS